MKDGLFELGVVFLQIGGVGFIVFLYGLVINGPVPPHERSSLNEVIYTRRRGRVAARIGAVFVAVGLVLMLLSRLIAE